MRTLVLLVLLALPSTASAATVEVLRTSSAPPFGPALAGDEVVFGSFPAAKTADLLAVAPGGSPRRLLRATSKPFGDPSLLAAATQGRVLARVDYEGGASELYGGALTGPLDKVESCSGSPDISFPPTPTLDGDLSAWSASGCVRDRIQIQLGASSRTVDASGYVYGLAAAGRYVAWLSNQPSGNPQVPDSRRLTVYDAQAGQVAYTLLLTPTDRLDVQADGTVALTQPDLSGNRKPCYGSPPERVTYFTPAEPVAHTVPVSSCFDTVKIAAGSIAFVEHLPSGGDRLALTNLAGTQVQPIARVEQQPTPTPDFDYDGTRVAWTQTRCRDYRLLRRDASDASPEDPAVTCPVKVGSPRLSGDGTLHVAVSCPHGCRPEPGASQQGIQVISPHWLHVRGKSRGVVRYSPFVKVDLRAGRRTVVRLPLTSHQRALLRRHTHVSVRLKVLLQNVYLPRLVRQLRST